MNPNDRRPFRSGDRVSYFAPLSKHPERREIGHAISNEGSTGMVLVEGPTTRNWYHRRELVLIKPRERIFWWLMREYIGSLLEKFYIRFLQP